MAALVQYLHKFSHSRMRSDSVCRGASSLVHYWYHPDSYDRCLPAEVAPEVVEPDKRIRGKPLFLRPCLRPAGACSVVSGNRDGEIGTVHAVHLLTLCTAQPRRARDTWQCRSVEG